MCLHFLDLFSASWPSRKRRSEAKKTGKQLRSNGIFNFGPAPLHQDNATARVEAELARDEPNSVGKRGQQSHYASNILNNFAPPSEDKLSEGKRAPRSPSSHLCRQQELQPHAKGRSRTTIGAKLEELTDDGNEAPALSTDSMGANGPQEPPAGAFRIRTAGRRHLDFDPPYELTEASAPQRSKWSGPTYFIQAADCQFGMIDSYVHHRAEPGWSEEIELCERLVAICNQMTPKPLFLIICGDLVDSLPKSDIGQRQVADFKRIFAKLDPKIPLVCVCGNHDVGDEPTVQTITDYRQTFGEDYFYFTKNDILFIVINSQFYQHRDNVQAAAAQQDAWLEGLLAKCKLFKHSIIFQHIPWFLERPDEENDYFNIRKEVRLGWLRKFREAGVTKIMCGHYHRNAGGWFEGMELVVTSAIGAQCGSDKSGVRIVKVLEDSIEHQYYAMPDIPLNLELKQAREGTPVGQEGSE